LKIVQKNRHMILERSLIVCYVTLFCIFSCGLRVFGCA